MLLPTLYDDPVTEYWALLNDVTMWDVAVERCVEISGPDALEFTNLLTCRDLTTCAVGQCKYVLLTDAAGGSSTTPCCSGWRRTGSGSPLRIRTRSCSPRAWPRCAGMDVDVIEADVSPMQIQGPRSKDVVRDLFGDEIADLRYYWCAEAEVNGIPVVVSRTGWTGEVGYEVYLQDSSRGDELWRAGRGGRRAVRHPGDRAVGGTPDRSGDLQLRLGHANRGHAVPHHRAGAARRARPGGRLHREGRAPADRARRASIASSSGSRSGATR